MTCFRDYFHTSSRGRVRWTWAGHGFRLFAVLLTAAPLFAQPSPWGKAAIIRSTELAGPIARGFSLVAIVLGGLTLAFSEGGGKRTLGGLIFGVSMALSAAQFVAWLFA